MNSVAVKETIQQRSNDDLWSPEQTETLVRLWTQEGKSASEIGRLVNKTRSAVIGKVHRMKLARASEAPVAAAADVIPLDRVPTKEEPQAAGGIPLPPVEPPRSPIAPVPGIIGDEPIEDVEEDEDGERQDEDETDNEEPAPIPVHRAEPEPVIEPAPQPVAEMKVKTKPVAKTEFETSPVLSAFPVEVAEQAVELPAGPKPGQNVSVISALRASDGGEGILLMKAGSFECKFPLWADNTAIDKKRVCGCKVVTGKSWCKTHFDVVFEPPRRK